jgi:hypothetical protein
MMLEIERRTDAIMKKTLLIILVACPCAFAQTQGNDTSQRTSPPNIFVYRTSQGTGATVSVKAVRKDSAPVQGAPYSATITTESVQTLADGNRIVVKTTGFVARDSLGRTRQQMELPAIGNLSAAKIPEIVFIQDPVAQVSYTLNLTDRTAHRMSPIMAGQGGPGPDGRGGEPGTAIVIAGAGIATGGPLPLPPSKDVVFVQNGMMSGEQSRTTSTDLGLQIIEGVVANGTRTTLAIPPGQIGNEKPISVVTEVWTSPDLKAIVYSKRNDPRMSEQTFQLTNIQRIEPNPSLFTVPSDFSIIDGPQPVVYKSKVVGPKDRDHVE